MITVELKFPAASRRTALQTLLALPVHLAPTRLVENEGERGEAIGDATHFLDAADMRDIGFFLKGPTGLIDISFAGAKPFRMSCWLNIKPHDAKTFLTVMAAAQPTFGFACTLEELERRNCIVVKIGVTAVESWVGFDAQRYVPGLYWLTLLPRALADRHHVPLPALAAAALEHVVLDGDQHLFRFYDNPSDWWRMDDPASHIPGARPGVFDIGPVQAKAETATSYAALSEMLRNWR